MKNKKTIKVVRITVVILLLCWCAMITTDYLLSLKAKPPIFAIASHIMDSDRYLGLGYTIFINYEGPVGFEGEELQGHFRWGWR